MRIRRQHMTTAECEKIYAEAYRAVYWTALALMKNEADAEDVDQCQGKTDDHAGDVAVCDLRSYAQDREDEYECQYTLDNEGLRYVIVEKTIAAESAVVRIKEYGEQKSTTAGTYKLGAPVEEHILKRHLFVDEHGQRNSRVDVASGDISDGICHRHDDQTESQSGQKISGRSFQTAPCYDRSSAAEEYQYECTDDLS